MLIDIGVALFAFGIFALMLENNALAVSVFAVAFYCVT